MQRKQSKRKEIIAAVITSIILGAALYPVYAEEPVIDRIAAQSHIRAGLSHTGFGEFGRAMEEFEQALYLDPVPVYGAREMAAFYYRAGMIYMLNSNTAGAITMFTKTYNLDVQDKYAEALSFAYSVHAKSLDVRNGAASAAAYRQEARNLNPSLDFGTTHRRIFSMTESHENAALIGMEISHAFNGVAARLFKQGDYAAARHQYALALVLMPGNARAQAGLQQATTRMVQSD